MSITNPQSKELSGLVEVKGASAISNSLLGHNDLFYAPKEQIVRIAKFAGIGITPTAYTNLSWMTDSRFMFPEFLKNQGLQTSVQFTCLLSVPRDLHHDDPTEVDLYLMFALKENVRIDPHLILLNMLGFSTSSGALGYLILISRIIEHALVDVSDTGYLITDPQEILILGQYIHFHMYIYKYEGMWTYFEDADFYPESPELPPPENS
ncbi:hypothetical protein Lal_00036649 [Lupinus albus]|nr:hypothetical protein Lal_00036649 [Lupinus albus]